MYTYWLPMLRLKSILILRPKPDVDSLDRSTAQAAAPAKDTEGAVP